LMARQGYEPTPVRLSAPQRVRYDLIDAPFNVARMVAWRAREAVYDITGRKPSANTILSER
ncbi:MAG: hypothetical protein M3O93_09820, partial [Chloroflexota bacterium]|nr:hypothetical protein [Chloroflexota bacterium]